MLRFAGARRWVWNWALGRRKEHYAATRKTLSVGRLLSELTVLKHQPETAWLQEAHAQSLQQAIRDLDRAYSNWFAGHTSQPTFKSKKRHRPAFRCPQNAYLHGNVVYVPKVGLVKVRYSQEVAGETKSVTFKREPSGHWYAYLVASFVMPDVSLPPPSSEKTVGVDAGLKDFFVLSNGERVEAPKFYRKGEKKLRRANKTLHRRKQGSKRREKARKRVARLHERTANQRKDFLHKHSIDLIRRFDCVCIENLSVSGLAKTKLAKSFRDAAHGEFRWQLEYKALWNRKRLVKVDRFFPSSKRCGGCGAIKAVLALAEREWTCPVCGVVHDRDLNAACNIKEEGMRMLAAGHAESLNAHGVDVRPATAG